MNLIFGTYNLDQKSNNAIFQAINENSKPPYYSQLDTWSNDYVHLGNYLNTPNSKNDIPIYTKDELTIIANARLDNHEELCKLLDIPNTKQHEIPNHILLLRAYQKWNVDCVNHIRGDWAFCIWNDIKKNFLSFETNLD